MFADLHLHTNFSDGTYGPQDLVRIAQTHGLISLASTDHDSVEGCPFVAAACRSAGLEYMPGTELTAELDGQELHLIGYFIDIQSPELLEALAKFQAARQNRILEMVARLNRLHIGLDAQSVFSIANCTSPGRPHVARALVKGGFCSSLEEAFDRFLKKHRPAWVPKFKISALDSIELIHQASGLAVMAHPALNRSDDAIPELVKAGLDGLECFHSKHSPETVERYLGIARKHNLLVTGGSDCHGFSKGKPTIGSVKLPYHYVERLKQQVNCTNPTPNPGQPARIKNHEN